MTDRAEGPPPAKNADPHEDGTPTGSVPDTQYVSLDDEDDFASMREAYGDHLAPAAADDRPATRAERIEWTSFLTANLGDIPWLPGKLMARGQQIALVGKGKAGKSLFAMEWAYRMAAGLPFLSDRPREPLTVMYADREQGRQDIQERMRSFGATAEQLARVVYVPFPGWPPLDTREGGQQFVEDVRTFGADVVFIDTVSRFIQGKENDSDTWLNLYMYTLRHLKKLEIASVRLDHFGKDLERGGRGSSAKEQDVDHVWEITETHDLGQAVTLKRTHSRTGHGEDRLDLRRLGEKVDGRWKAGATRHVLTTEATVDGWTDPVDVVIAQLDELGVPVEMGRERARNKLLQHNIKVRNETLAEALRRRKNLSPRSGDRSPGQLSLDHGDRSA